MRRRLIVTLLLAIVTTVLVAWSPRVFHAQPADRMRMGKAVRDDMLISYDEPRWWGMTRQSWDVFDLTRDTWDSESKREEAAEILEYGAPAAFDRTVAAATEIARQVGRTLPELPPIERADDLAERGPPITIARAELPDSGLTYARTRCGWPLPALAMESRHHFVYPEQIPFGPKDIENVLEVEGAIELPWSRRADEMRAFNLEPVTYLPVRLLPTGFLLDTLLFFGVWSMLLVAPLALRRQARRLRGQCKHCGYRTHNLARCPECGRNA